MMALGGEETSFPRGKEATPEPAAGKKKAGGAAANGAAGAGAAGGRPAAKRKREAKAATAAAMPAQADSGPDFLFGGLPKKKPKQQGRGDDDAEGGVGGGKVDEATKLAQAVGLGCVTKAGRGPPEIQPIAWKKLGKGTTVLGLVARVGPRDVAVSLPGGMVGRVTFPEISDPLYARFAAAAQAAGMAGPEAAAQAAAEAEALALASLKVGQVMRCAVLAGSPGTAATEAKKAGGKGGNRLALSLRASLVNRGMKLEHLLPGGALAGAVASEEDHGYVVNTGLEGVTAFLPKKHAKGAEPLSVGQPIEAVVLAVNEAARTLTCGHDPSVAPKATTRGLGALTLQGLKPGMLVNAAVDMVLRNGLALTFLGGFSGAATLEHLDRAYPEGDWRKRFRLGDVVVARVLLVDYQKKAVYLTLRPHLLGLRPASSVPAVGTRLEELTVLRVDKKKGLLLGLPVAVEGDQDAQEDLERAGAELEARAARAQQAKKENEDDGGLLAAEEAKLRKLLLEAPRFVPVLVHASQVDKEGKDALGKFAVGQVIKACRVVGTAPVEGAAHGSLKAETLSAPFVRVADVAPGQLVEAEVAAVAGWGLTLDLGQGIKAHCTNMHLADGAGPKATALRAKAVAEAKKKGGTSQQPGVYKAGQRVACRVLQVDPQTRKVYATLKRSLVKDPAPPLAAYAEAQPGRVCLGFVTRVAAFGVIVTFYGNVHGLLPAAHLAAQGGVEDPTEAFRVGQVLRCVVHSSDPFHDPPRLSLRLDVPSAGSGKEAGTGSEATLVPGTRVSGVVEKVQDPYAYVRVDAAAGGKKKGGAQGPLAMLHKHQLGDHAALADQLLARVAKGQRIEGALVLENRREGGVLLSLKPLLLGAKAGGVLDAEDEDADDDEEEVPKLTELHAGKTRLCGYVTRVEPFGLFVRFVGGQVALAPRALIADRFVDDAQGLFREGDSVRCLLARVDADKGKAFVTTQRSKLPVTSPAFLETLLAESASAGAGASGEEQQALGWRRFPIGATVNATVTAVKDYGVVLSAADDTHRTVLLAPAPEHVLTCAPGDEVKVRVLDVDWAKRVLVATLLPDLVKRGRAKHRKAAEGKGLVVGSRAEATVVLKRDRYAVVEVGGALAYLAVADYQCPYLATGNLEVGVGVDVVVRRAWRPELEKVGAAVSYPQEAVMLCTLAQEDAEAEAGAGSGKGKRQQGKGKDGKSAEDKAAERAARKAEKAERKAAKAQERAEERKGAKQARDAKAAAEKKKRPRAVPASALVPGAMLPALVARVKPDELLLAVNVEEEKGSGKSKTRVLARVYVTHGGRLQLADLEEALQEAAERKEGETALPSYHPFAGYEQGQEVEARVLSVQEKGGEAKTGLAALTAGAGAGAGRKTLILECSLRPQDLVAPDAAALAALQPGWGNKKDKDTVAGTATAALRPGACWGGVVTEVQEEGLAVALSRAVRGFVHALDVAQAGEASPHARLLAAGAVGLPLAVMVARVEPSRFQLQLSLRGVPPEVEPKALPLAPSADFVAEQAKAGGGKCLPKEGDIVTGRIRKPGVAGVPSLGALALAVQLGHRLYARLDATEVADPEAWRDQPLGEGLGLHDGQDVRCRVLSVDPATGRVDVSLRPSRLRAGVEADEATADDPAPEEGQVVHGFVVSTTPKGCWVRLSRGVTARVLLKDLADGFVQNPGQAFPQGKLVAGRVLRVGEGGGGVAVDVSLRPSVVVGEAHLHPLAFEDLEEGMKLKGAVTRVETFGVFVRLEGSAVTGLCHVSEASDGGRVKDLGKLYAAGDVVKAFVLKVDEEKKRVSLSLKASRFTGDADSDSTESESESEEEGSESELEEEEAMVARMMASSSDEGSEDEEEEGSDDSDEEEEQQPYIFESDSQSDEADDAMEVDESDDSEDDEDATPAAAANGKASSKVGAASAASVAGAGGFQWDDFDLGLGTKAGGDAGSSSDDDGSDDSGSDSGDESGSEEDGEGGKKRKHRSSRKKAAKRRREEEEVRAREERLLDPDAPPETADDFERLVLASPNSSFVWIRYMAYHLSLADIDAARALAARALKTIVYREEGEKMNVWVALLNLEHKYGSKESVRATLEQAAQQAHPKHVHLHAAEMYERAGQLDEAEDLFQLMAKKFKYSKQVWMRYHALALKRDPAAATELLRRSLQCLSRHKHALVISHFAQAEFEFGSVDRGRTIFEGLVSSYPRRLDLWNVYVDKEVKAGHIEAARRLLDRMCTLKLSAPKMKGVLKRYLKLEMEHGDAASVEAVKERARQYVEQSLA